MRHVLSCLLISAQTLCAGLERYSQLVVADLSPAKSTGGGIRVTYLGTNGFEFESGTHALLVDPYFSRINFSRVALGLPVQPNVHRIYEAMTHLARKVDAIV